MRAYGVALVTLCGLLGCGGDPILERAAADAAAEKAEKAEKAPGSSTLSLPTGEAPPPGGSPPPGSALAATPPPGGGAVGADGEPIVGIADAPAPGDPSVPPPGGSLGDPSIPPPGGAIGAPGGEPKPGDPNVPPPGGMVGDPTVPPPGGVAGAPGVGGYRGPTVEVRGLVAFADYKGGSVRITAFNGDHASGSSKRPEVVGQADLARPGAFTVRVPENAGKVYFEASVDEDGDGRPGPLEPQGKADRFPITVKDSAVDDLEIILKRREPPPGGRGTDF